MEARGEGAVDGGEVLEEERLRGGVGGRWSVVEGRLNGKAVASDSPGLARRRRGYPGG